MSEAEEDLQAAPDGTQEAGSESRAEDAKPAAQSPPAEVAPPWQPPETFGDHFSRWSVRGIQLAVIATGFTLLLTFVLWAIPTYQAAASPAYALAVKTAEKNGLLRSFLGGPLQGESIPRRYSLTEDGGEFTFVVHGEMGRAAVVSTVEGGRVVKQRPHLTIDWTRPLLEQLDPALRRGS